MIKLTPRQMLVLSSAVGLPTERKSSIPNGVYRSLIIRGLLAPHPCGYALTERGRDALSAKTFPQCWGAA